MINPNQLISFTTSIRIPSQYFRDLEDFISLPTFALQHYFLFYSLKKVDSYQEGTQDVSKELSFPVRV